MRPSDDPPSLDPLGHGLRAGFGGERGASVVDRLEHRLGSSLRVALPDLDVDRDPVVTPVSARSGDASTRYAVLGEIARGGIGVVLKGRDLDLGRDVAMKVLHERFHDDPQVIERFVEEAQIGGQLQHPGIVPVYELGLQADDRPFFAMKLVKGQTLAEELRRRTGPGDATARFLSIFLSVCQTVAYAHARRVVHRDIKPSNVLVGSFGEVQVADWGLAKVLRRGGVADEKHDGSVVETVRSGEGSSPSLAGSVLGTPAYMPPEQARGEVGRMDERSDVFALGAVLCEILSGKPPYAADDPAAALRQATDCRLEPALARLAESDADPDLVALARVCLSPSRDARPADAGQVAKRVEAWLAATEARARRAEVQAAELRVRARSTALVAAVVVFVLLAAGATWKTLDASRRERQTETVVLANAAIVEATRFVGQAEQAGLGGVDLWAQAVASASRAREIAAAGDAPPALTRQVEVLAADLDERERSTRAEALRERGHDLLLERVLEARVGPDVVGFGLREGPARRLFESSRRDDEYAVLLGEVGFDAATTDAEAARALTECGHRAGFALALDSWAEARRVMAAEGAALQPEAWRRLVRLARAIEPDDPWRSSLRDELAQPGPLDIDGLRALARPDALAERSAEEVALLVNLIDATGEDEVAAAAQVEGIRHHPADFWLNVSLADVCDGTSELVSRMFEAEIQLAVQAAISARPESRRARFGLSIHRFMTDRGGDELARELVREAPDDPIFRNWLFSISMARGRYDEAAAEIPIAALRVDQLDWDYADFLVLHGHTEYLLASPGVPPLVRACLLVELERVDEAWTLFEQHRSDGVSWPWYSLTLLLEASTADELGAVHARLIALIEADEATLAAARPEEVLSAAELCKLGWRDLLGAVRLYRWVFEHHPETKEIWFGATRMRKEGACVAALAAAGVTPGTENLTGPERRTLRQQARAWLHEELDTIESDLANPDIDQEMLLFTSMMFHQMLLYGRLAPIREAEYLDDLPREEAHKCRVLWARVRGVNKMLDHLMATRP